jgi:hypothetical protein
MVAGALYGAIHKILGEHLKKIIHLPRNGRRPLEVAESIVTIVTPSAIH